MFDWLGAFVFRREVIMKIQDRRTRIRTGSQELTGPMTGQRMICRKAAPKGAPERLGFLRPRSQQQRQAP